MAFQTLEVTLPTQAAAGASITTLLGAAPSAEAEGAIVVSKVSLTSPSLVTGQATNFATVTVRQMRAGAFVANVATLALSASSVTLPAEVETNVALVTTSLAPGDVLDVQQVQTGTGLLLPAGIVVKVELA